MNPTPLCKTAIISFVIDEVATKLWNLSSNMRKRVQMIIGNRDITVKEYSPKALLFNGWAREGFDCQFISGTEDIKKGMSNYILTTQEHLDKIISLNGKLRCSALSFLPGIPLECDSIESRVISKEDFDFHLKSSFRRIRHLNLNSDLKDKIEQLSFKIRTIDCLFLSELNFFGLNLSNFKVKKLILHRISSTESIHLPDCLDSLELRICKKLSIKNTKKVKRLEFSFELTNDTVSYSWIKSFTGLKTVRIQGKLSEYIEYLPSSIRYIQGYELGLQDIDLVKSNKNLVYLIKIGTVQPIKVAQALNLRDIKPIMSQTEEVFTLRPKRIEVDKDNVEELNKHPELFEKVEEVKISSGKFNFDCLTERMKKIEFGFYRLELKQALSWRKNCWKFKEAEIKIGLYKNPSTLFFLDSFETTKKVKIVENFGIKKEDHPHLRIEFMQPNY